MLLVADQYQITRADRRSCRGASSRAWSTEVADGVRGVAVGDRVAGTVLVGAFAEEVAVAAASVRIVPPGVDDRHAAAFGVAWRTAYHVLRSVARLQPGDELVVLGAGGGVGLAAVSLGAPPRCLGDGGGLVRGQAGGGPGRRAPPTSSSTPPSTCGPRCREVLPGGADVVVDPVGGDLAEPALRSLRWGGRFVTVGYASGVIPRIPLNLVLLKGCQVLGFQFRDFAEHCPDELVRNDDELWDAPRRPGRWSRTSGPPSPSTRSPPRLGLVADGKAVGKVVLDVAPAADG